MIATAPLTISGDAALVTLGVGGKALGSTVNLYRGVGAAEAADVAATGALRNLPGAMEDIKHVTNSFEAASRWAAQFGQADGQVLRITVSRDATASFTSLGRIDGIGQAWTAPLSALKNAQVETLSLTPK
jgi:hypothetical protein